MRRFVLLVGAASVAMLTACASTVVTPAGHKPSMVGLIDKGSERPYHQGVPYPVIDTSGVAAHSPAFAGIVVNQTWSQVEPSPGTFDFTTLDASLAKVAAYNATHVEAQLGVRLRVFAAYAAPGWAKALDGTPITVAAKPPGNTGGTPGQWWKPRYRAAWSALQQALASRYDSNPVLHDVAVSSCSSLTAEPFVIGAIVVPLAKADGWTLAAQQACLDGALSDYAPWVHTAIYYPTNPLDGDSTISDEVMQRCAHSVASGGPWCILANNALSPISATTGRSAPVYDEMNTLWTASPHATPIAFQMNGPDNASYCAAIGVAVSHHAQSVELWPATAAQPGYTTLSTTTLETWSNALRITGIPPTCPS